MPDPSKLPIFYDPQHRRWSRFKRITLTLVSILGVIFCVLLASVFSVPDLPGRNLLAPVLTQAPIVHIATPRPGATPSPTTTLSANREKNYQEALTKLKSYIATPRKASTPTLYPARKKGEIRGTPTPRRPAQPIITWTPTPLATRIAQINPATAQPAALPVAQPTSTYQPPTPGPQPNTEVIGFYVNWDDNSLTSLKENLTRMDKVIPEWLHLVSADGNILDDNPDQEAQVLSLVREQRPGLAVVPLVNNFNTQTQEWDGASLSALLDDPAARARAIQNLLDFVQNNHLAGISVDFENLPDDHQPALETFMSELYARFQPLGLEVSQSIPIQDTAYDARTLANSSDYLILMAYDEYSSGTEPGPAASQAWFSNVLRSRLAEAPAGKYVILVGNYGYDWAGSDTAAVGLTFQEAIQKARKSNTGVSFDPAVLNPTFSYSNGGVQHKVWYLDAATLFNELVEAQRYGPRGFGLWRLGSEDPTVWKVFEQRNQLDATAADSLRPMRYGYGIAYEGTGEILKVEATPSEGERQLSYDSLTGLVAGEQITAYPSSYIISRWGGQDKKKIALTFDDGPDPSVTPLVLDILKRYQVPATFFIVGVNGDLYSDLLQRIVDEGHEVGSHTFTHPDVSAITPEQFQLELNATERLFESRLGLRSILFRPPYGEDVEPDTPEQVKPLLLTSQLGYYTIGMKIDPKRLEQPRD
ncbi:MAG TPA: polysaccharide deacetylase family protein [Anaerolineales bacterium]